MAAPRLAQSSARASGRPRVGGWVVPAPPVPRRVPPALAARGIVAASRSPPSRFARASRTPVPSPPLFLAAVRPAPCSAMSAGLGGVWGRGGWLRAAPHPTRFSASASAWPFGGEWVWSRPGASSARARRLPHRRRTRRS